MKRGSWLAGAPRLFGSTYSNASSKESLRRNPNLGAAQPEDEPEGQVMVVSKEHTAKQVREVIAWRERWLAQEGLPRDTLMNDEQKDACLAVSKKKSRWMRNLKDWLAPHRCGTS